MIMGNCVLRGSLLTFLVWALANDLRAQVSTNVVNDGTSADNLVAVENQNGRAATEIDLSVQAPPPGLIAAQTPDYSDFPVNAVWYNRNVSTPGPGYAVRVDAQPSGDFAESIVGAMGWLTADTNNAVVFRVTPGVGTGYFSVSTLNFSATTDVDNDSVADLYSLDGSAATATQDPSALGTAESALGDYASDRVATFVLQFSAPTPADKAALSKATAHITAMVLQSPDGTSDPVQVGTTIELLTDLPTPDAHRFGYAAKWGTSLAPGGTIGTFSRLALVGQLDQIHLPPTIAITNPADGATLPGPVTITLAASAQADNALITKVEFFQGGNLIGTVTAPPYAVYPTLVAPTNYTFTAKATDSLGATTVSAPVTISVTASTAGPATLSAPRPSPDASTFLNFTFNLAGTAGATYITEGTMDFKSWSPVSTNTLSGTSTNTTVTVSRPAGQAFEFYRANATGTQPSGEVKISSVALLPSAADFQTFQFTVIGLVGKAYTIQSTTDFVTWTAEASGTGANQVEQFSFARQPDHVFYRLLLP